MMRFATTIGALLLLAGCLKNTAGTVEPNEQGKVAIEIVVRAYRGACIPYPIEGADAICTAAIIAYDEVCERLKPANADAACFELRQLLSSPLQSPAASSD